jgi:HEAT repeat protein
MSSASSFKFAVLIVFALVISIPVRQSEAQTGDEKQSLAYWINRLNSPDDAVHAKAVEFLYQTEKLRSPSIGLYSPERVAQTKQSRETIRQLIPQLIKTLQSRDEDVQGTAMMLLSFVEEDAKAAIPALKKMFQDSRGNLPAQLRVIVALLHITPDNTPVGPLMVEAVDEFCEKFQEKLRQIDENPRTFGDNDDQQIDSIIDAIGSPNAVFYVVLASGHTKVEISYLVKLTEKKYPDIIRAVVFQGISYLCFYSEIKSADVVPALRRQLKDENRLIRRMAAHSIIVIEHNPNLLPELVRTIEVTGKERTEFEKVINEHFEVQKQLAEDLKDSSQEVVPELILILKFGNRFERHMTLNHLRMIGPGAKAALPELRKALQVPNEGTRRLARKAINEIDIRPAVVAPKPFR